VYKPWKIFVARMRIADTKLEWAFFGVAVAQFVLVTLLQM
jgi:hypothetical protein